MWRNPYFRVNKHLQLVYSSRAVCPNKKWLLLAGRADVDLEREREEGERHDDGDYVVRAQIVRLQNDFLTRKPSSWTWKRDGEGGGRKRLDDAKACFAATHDADLCKALYAGMKNAWRKTHLQSSCLHPYHTPAQASRVTCDPWWIVPVVGFGASWTWTGEEEEEKKWNENNIYIYIFVNCTVCYAPAGLLLRRTALISSLVDKTQHTVNIGAVLRSSTCLYHVWKGCESINVSWVECETFWLPIEPIKRDMRQAHGAIWSVQFSGICKRWRERYLNTVCVSTFFDFFLRI